ncbi:MAG TPA: copper resistance CopC family protein [Candidatus Sulfotelmatobacter sp.]|jgi:methionine-rich copper-binding protein CopC|nr:copper resistance CopC family protein [Candidatus Sulfotelmatobacter sp.]
MDRRFALTRIIAGTVALAALLAAGRIIEGHAILKESSPAANATVAGPDVAIMLKYNSRVDATRSKVQLSHPDNSVSDLPLAKQVSPDTLSSKATGLTPGAYKLQWQVLAPDGHITRGVVPFTVKGS